MNLENTVIQRICRYRDGGSIGLSFENGGKQYELVLQSEVYEPTNIRIYKYNHSSNIIHKNLTWEDSLKVLKTFQWPAVTVECSQKVFDELIVRISKKIEREKLSDIPDENEVMSQDDIKCELKDRLKYDGLESLLPWSDYEDIEDSEFHRLRKNHEETQERLENYIKDNF